MGKDRGFCPFISSERSDGNINKVECSKKCALFVDDNCALVKGPTAAMANMLGPILKKMNDLQLEIGSLSSNISKSGINR